MSRAHETYYEALAADGAYQAALEKQFGEGSSRWEYSQCLYNVETKAAYVLKVDKDLELHNIIRRHRELVVA